VEVDQTALEGWREMLQGFVKAKPQADGTLGKPRPLPQGLKSIEVTGKPDREGKTRMLIFEPPGWQGRLVN